MADVVLNPYLQFNGNAEEVLNFYKSIFGGEAEISRFSDFPGMPVAADQQNKVMHSVLKTGSFQLMLSDAMPMGGAAESETRNGSVSLSGDDDALLSGYFNGLSAGGEVTQALTVHPWGDKFGMVTDKFDVRWLVNISQTKA